MSEEENKELNRAEERLKELSKCGLFLDNIFIKDKTARQILVSAYNKLERQQKEIKKEKSRIMELTELLDKQENEIELLHQELEIQEGCSISKNKIRAKLKELEEQKERLKFDGNRSFADYEQFCKNLKFFKDQIEELLEENTNE